MDELKPKGREIQENRLKARLETARKFVRGGQEEEAERLYKQALEDAEALAGESSPLVGLVLVDLIDFYDHCDRRHEGKLLWSRLRQVIIAYLKTDEWGAELVAHLDGNDGQE